MTSLAERLSTRKLKKAEKLPVILTRGRIYIVPTRHGFLFGIVLFSMLLGAINYNNSLAFALTFLLFSMIVVSILHTHRNLAGLQIEGRNSMPVFSGEPAQFSLILRNNHNYNRLAISLQTDNQSAQTLDLPSGMKTIYKISMPAMVRGYLTPGRIKIYTEYPLGLVHAWSWTWPDITCLIYPRPEENAPPPAFQQDGEGEHIRSSTGDDDFSGLRPYRPGDSTRRVAWKQSSWRDEIFTKEFTGGGMGKSLWLEWDHAGSPNTEHRLSRLCRWILDCESAGIAYGLRLPERTIEPSSGEAHKHECLKTLALFGNESST